MLLWLAQCCNYGNIIVTTSREQNLAAQTQAHTGEKNPSAICVVYELLCVWISTVAAICGEQYGNRYAQFATIFFVTHTHTRTNLNS